MSNTGAPERFNRAALDFLLEQQRG